MHAEAQNYLNSGPTGSAMDALRQVRDRAGISSMAIPSSQKEFEKAILQERKWEFASELYLRTDIIRMNLLTSELTEAQQEMKDLSDRKNKFADVPRYRLYKFDVDAQAYGDQFLAIDYIHIRYSAETSQIQSIPTDAGDYHSLQETLASLVSAHGIPVENGDSCYPGNM